MGRVSIVDLFLLTTLDYLLRVLKTLFIFYKTSYTNEEVNCTEPSLSVSILWLIMGRSKLLGFPKEYHANINVRIRLICLNILKLANMAIDV